MERLMNGAFYLFLVSQNIITFQHNSENYDWIPVQVRMQLVKLLDAWRAAQMRLMRLQNQQSDFDPEAIALVSLEEVDHRRRFEYALNKACQEAARLRDLNCQHGILDAPEPDLGFWRQVCKRELYEARLAAGEPVVFYKDRCCLYGSLAKYRYAVVPGPYPGLQYYHLFDNACAPDEKQFWMIAQRERYSDERMQKEPIPMGYGAIPCHVKRQRLMDKCNIIGPATYAEFVNQHGFLSTIDATEEHKYPREVDALAEVCYSILRTCD